MSNKWQPANRFLGVRKRHALENGRSGEWIEADIVGELKSGELVSRGQPVTWRRIGPDNRLLSGSGLERELGLVVDISAEFWDGLIFHGGGINCDRKDWDNGNFAWRYEFTDEWEEFDAVQISQPTPPLPPDNAIAAQAAAMIAKGQSRDEVAKSLRLEPGFEAVTNEHVRRVIKGTKPRGRPRNNPTE